MANDSFVKIYCRQVYLKLPTYGLVTYDT